MAYIPCQMSFDPKPINLPIVEILDEIKSQLREENTLIVCAPGAGKSTLLPIALFFYFKNVPR